MKRSSLSLLFAVFAFDKTVVRDIPLTSTHPLYLNHRIGNISISGSVQDRLQVVLKMHTLAENENFAKEEFNKLDFITLETGKSFEFRVGRKRGSDLVSKMRDANHAQVSVDLEIKAPMTRQLTVISGEGKNFELSDWRGGVDFSGTKTTLSLSKLDLKSEININCPGCTVELRDSKAAGHILVANAAIVLNRVDAKEGLTLEANKNLKIEKSKGRINARSTTGRMTVDGFDGRLSFLSAEGGTDINQFSGNLSVRTGSGQILVDVAKLPSLINVDTEKSDIQVSLPSTFAGHLDLLSLRGEVVVQFPYQNQKTGSEIYGPMTTGRVDATVGEDRSSTVHANTKQGGVRILRKSAGLL